MRPGWTSHALSYLASGLVLFAAVHQAAATLTPALQQLLDSSTYVYIQSERKSGALGPKAEIWFMHHEGAVWVISQDFTYRVKRIRADRTRAKVWVGKEDGPAFEAIGALINDATSNEVLLTTFAKKYPDGWPKFEAAFRKGLAEGSFVLIKYTPISE